MAEPANERTARPEWLTPVDEPGRPATRQASSPAIVPGRRLLEAATTLADGATEVHSQLRDLDPEKRDAVLEVFNRQLNAVVGAWLELVRDMLLQDELPHTTGVVPAGDSGAKAGNSTPAAVVTGPAGGFQASGETSSPSQAPDVSAVRVPSAMRQEAGDPGGEPRAAHGAAGSDPRSYRVGESRTRDELTGILDRPATFSALRREMERSRRLHDPLVLGFLDVNGLRLVNNTRGLRAGDDLLVSVAKSLQAILRDHDVVGRVGGDKFVFAMSGVDIDRARARFSGFIVTPEETTSPSRVVRIGFAELRGDDSVEDLVTRAETGLARPNL